MDQNTSIAAGTEVNFLGVIDITQGVAASGQFATFIYRDKSFNADADLFLQSKKRCSNFSSLFPHI
jgi:hypothetical protein